jgi:hypothetical protein
VRQGCDATAEQLEVARIWVWQPADMAPTPSGEQLAERKKAAQFGANGLILGLARIRL